MTWHALILKLFPVVGGGMAAVFDSCFSLGKLLLEFGLLIFESQSGATNMNTMSS